MNTKQKYFSNLFSDADITAALTEKKNIILKGGTGSGKSTLIKNKVAANAKCLYLVPRCKLKQEIARYANENIIIQSTQYFETKLKYKSFNDIITEIIMLYDVVVFDEVHLIIDDSLYNKNTDFSFRLLLQLLQEYITVFLISATGETIFNYLVSENLIDNKNIYTIEKSYDNYNCIPIKYSQSGTYLFNQIEQLLHNTPEHEKIIYFARSKEAALNVYNALNTGTYKNKIHFACSPHETKYSYSKINEIDIITESYPDKLLICTTVIDVGINLTDENIKYIITDLLDINSIIQCLGRRRTKSISDHIDFYFVNYPSVTHTLRAKQQQLQRIMEIKQNADEYTNKYKYDLLEMNEQKYIKLVQHENKFDIQIRETALLKLKQDIELYNQIYQRSFLDVLIERLNGCKVSEEVQPLSRTIKDIILSEYADRNLYQSDREELINIIGLRDRHRNLQKKFDILEQYLKRNYNIIMIKSKDKNRTIYWKILKE